MRGTIKVFLKKEQVKRDKGNAKDATPVPAVVATASVVDAEQVAQKSIEVPVTTTVAESNEEVSTNTAETEAEPSQELAEPQTRAIVDAVDEADVRNSCGIYRDRTLTCLQNQSEADSDSSSVEIHIGNDDDHIQKPVYGPNAVTQPNGQRMEQVPPSSGQNGQTQNGSFDNSQMQNASSFNGINFDPSSFQQMQQMMMQGGMGGMPSMNMMSEYRTSIFANADADLATDMPGMGDMSAMMQMFNNNLNSFGMNGMSGMNGMPGMPGMNMGGGMGFGNMGYGGGFNQQMNGSFGGNGYYPNGGYNQRQMHNAQFPNQYQHGFRRGNYQQRGHGRGYHRGHYYDQQAQYGQNAWANQGDHSGQVFHGEGSSGAMAQNGEPSHHQGNETDNTNGMSAHEEAQDERQNQADDGHDAQEPQAIPSEDPGAEQQHGDGDVTQELPSDVNDSTMQDLEMHGGSHQIDSYQAQYGPSGRGRPFARGRGSWRGRGGYMGYGSSSHAQVGAAVTLTSAAPPENAPTGPKAMREGHPPSFGGRGGHREVLNGLDTPHHVNREQSVTANDEELADRSRAVSNARSLQDEGEKSGSRYRNRSRSGDEDDYDRRNDRKSRRSSHKYEDGRRAEGNEKYGDEVRRSRDSSVDSSRRHSSRRDKDKHRSSRSQRDHSRERRHKRRRSRSPDRVRELERQPMDAMEAEDKPSSETSRRKRHRDHEDDEDYDRDRERKRAKDRHRDRDRSKDRKRERSAKEYYSDEEDLDLRSSHRSRREKKSRHRDREDDKHYDDTYDDKRYSSKTSRHYDDQDDYEARKASRRSSKSHKYDGLQASEAAPADEVGFSILGRSSNRSREDGPPTGPASMRPPPTGPRAQTKVASAAPSASSSDRDRHGRASETSSKSRPQTPLTTETAATIDPYQAEREKRNRERMAREQQRGKKQEDFAPPTGPRRRH